MRQGDQKKINDKDNGIEQWSLPEKSKISIDEHIQKNMRPGRLKATRSVFFAQEFSPNQISDHTKNNKKYCFTGEVSIAIISEPGEVINQNPCYSYAKKDGDNKTDVE